MKKVTHRLITCLTLSLLLSTGCSSKAPVANEYPAKQTSKQEESATQLITLQKFDVASTTVTDNSQKMLGLEYTVQFALPKKVSRNQIDRLGCQLKFSKKTWEVLGVEGSGVAQQLEPAGQDDQNNLYQVRFTHASTTLTKQQIAALIESAKTDVVVEIYADKKLERTLSVSDNKK